MGLGKTLDEVKRMSMSELATWTEYVQENGPLNFSLRMEAAVARAVTPFLRKANFRDFMPWPRQPEGEPPVDQMKSGLLGIFRKAAAKTKLSKE